MNSPSNNLDVDKNPKGDPEKYSKELFGKIKLIQSLPDEIVEKFLLSKGMLAHSDIKKRIDEKEK